jgi:hypothetical protein
MASLLPLVGLLAVSGPISPSAPDAAPKETSVIAGLGVAGGEGAGGLGVALLATHHFRWFELGLEAHAAALVARLAGAGCVGGLHFGEHFSLRLLGSAGIHSYAGVGRRLLSDDPGVSGSAPYAGGRLVLGYSFPARAGLRHRGFVGFMGAVDQDLVRSTRTVSYIEEGWFFGGTTEQTSSHTVGQLTMAGFLVAGVDLDLLGD